MRFFGSLFFLFLFFIGCDEDKVKGESKPVSIDCYKEANNPNCFSTNIHSTPTGIEEYRSEVFGEGDVVTFRWDETLTWFLENEKHIYGYDRDPYSNYSDEAPERGRDVYMSVKKGEMAQVSIYVSPEAIDVYHLHALDEKYNIKERDVIDVSNLCSNNRDGLKCKGDFSLPEGIYAVYYDTDKGEIDKSRYLHILGYTPKTYSIDFVQFGDEYDDECISDAGNGCYTNQWVEERFNKIMAQAVVEGKFNALKPEDIGMDDFFTIDLTDQHEVNDIDDTPIARKIITDIRKSKQYGYGEQIETFREAFKEIEFTCIEANGAFEGEITEIMENYSFSYKCNGYDTEKNDEFNRVYSNLENAFSRLRSSNNIDKKHLTLGINKMRLQWRFLKDDEIILNNYNVFQQALYMMNLPRLKMFLKKEGETKEIPVIVEGKEKGADSFSAIIYEGNNQGHRIASLNNGTQYYIYADVYPFVPTYPFTPENIAQQITFPVGNPVTGGIVWGSHLKGTASLNTIIHEIGHSFGLTDLEIAKDDPTYYYNYQQIVKNLDDVLPPFAFNESNLMAYAGESGERIRYRPLFVALTGNGSKIPQGKTDQERIIYETEKQWDCIRSSNNCYRGEKK